jgi:ABC-type uncharacterized transport system involved in gliding motility auxiliary subunit
MTEANGTTTPLRESFLERVRQYFGNLSLSFAAGGLLLLLGAGATYLVGPEDLKTPAQILTALGLLLLLLFIFTAFNQLKTTLMGRRGRYGLLSILMVLAFVGIVAAVNSIGAQNSARYDSTATKQFTLSLQTRNILKNLDERVEAVGFFDPTHPNHIPLESVTRDLLEEYSRVSHNFRYEIVDPLARPSVARRFNVTSLPAIVFAAEQRAVQVFNPTEQNFTTALLVVTGQQRKTVYFLTGHGERDPDDLTDISPGLGLAHRGLLGDNYEVATLKLDPDAQPTVPEDAAALVIAGPQSDLASFETEPLTAYLREGGNAIFLLDPNPPESFNALLGKWGVGVEPGVAVDNFSSLTGDKRTPIVNSKSQFSPTNPIAQPLNATLFPQATEVHRTFERAQAFITVEPLVLTSGDSWQETDPGEDSFDGRVDKQGPLWLAAAVEATAPLDESEGAELLVLAKANTPEQVTRIVVIGDADFASNRFFTFRNNGDLFLNSVNWLTQDVNLIAIRPKPIIFRQLVVNQREWNFIRFSSWLLLPSVVALFGGLVWWRRR